jgi:hypothetical protein
MRFAAITSLLLLSTIPGCSNGDGEASPDGGVENRAPTANAGVDRTVGRGTRVSLDGRSSSDPDSDPLAYSWLLATAPATSTAALSDPESATPELVLDVVGVYELSLIVDDGELSSAPDLVRITVAEGMPVARAGADQSVARGTVVVLDGTDSSDVDGDPLSYAWSLAAAPAGSAAAIADTTAAETTLSPDLPGQYLVDLVVDDGTSSSAPDRVVITATNAAPVVSAGADLQTEVGETVQLVGTASDAEGDPLEVMWTITEQPASSAAAPATPSALTTTLTLDEPGVYRLTLTASDGFVSASDEVLVLTAPDLIVLTHDVVDAEYSRPLDRIVLISDDTSGLSILDPETGDELEVDLPVAPMSVSVSPNGLQAVVGHDGWVSVVDLVTATVSATWPSSAIGGDVIHGGNGYAYMIPQVDQWQYVRCVAIATGAETLGSGLMRAGSRGRRHPTQSAFYLADRDLSPSDIEKHSIAAGVSDLLYDSPYHGDYAMCGNLWFSEEGLRIFTACGNVFRASTNQSVDMTYNGSLSDTDYLGHLDHSSAAQLVAVLPLNGWDEEDADTRIDLYDDEFLAFDGSIVLPGMPIGSEWVQTHGMFVFFDQDGSALYAILKATPMAGVTRTVIWRAL